jgi:hypothetical protein
MGKVSDLMKKYGKTAEDIIIDIEFTLDKLFDPSGKARKARDEAARFKPEEAIKKKAKGGLIKKYGIQKKGTSRLLKGKR